MLKIINTSGQIDDLFDKGAFSRDKWREYINSIYEDSSHLFEDEVEDILRAESIPLKRTFCRSFRQFFKTQSGISCSSPFWQ